MKLFFYCALVGSFVLPVALRAAEPVANTQTAEAADVELNPQQVRDAVHLILKREATAKTPDERAAAIRDLAKLYLAIARDEELAETSRLRLKAIIYRRLVSIKTELEYNIRRHAENPDADLPQYPVGESLADEQQEARGGGAVRDYGEELVELIEHVISPDHWDVNGGPGSIVYYPNLKVLVVRASGDVHGHVGGLFDGLRRP